MSPVDEKLKYYVKSVSAFLSQMAADATDFELLGGKICDKVNVFY